MTSRCIGNLWNAKMPETNCKMNAVTLDARVRKIEQKLRPRTWCRRKDTRRQYVWLNYWLSLVRTDTRPHKLLWTNGGMCVCVCACGVRRACVHAVRVLTDQFLLVYCVVDANCVRIWDCLKCHSGVPIGSGSFEHFFFPYRGREVFE